MLCWNSRLAIVSQAFCVCVFMNFCLRSKVSNQADIARILVSHSQHGYQHIGPTEIPEPLRREICDEFRQRFGEKIYGKSRILVKNHKK